MSDAAPALGSRPNGLPATNLAEALAPAKRGSRLAGRLAPARLPAATTTSGAGNATTSPSSSRPGRSTTRPPAPRDEPAAPPSRGAPRPVIVYLPVSLRDRLRQLTVERDLTYTELVLESVDATHQRLQSLLTPEKSARTRSLFQQPSTPRRRRHAEPHVQVSLRLVPEDLAVIDRLVTDLNAGSRSHLVATALQAHVA